MSKDTIGVDISKDRLDAHRMCDGASRRFANDKAGHAAFTAWVGATGVRVVYEPTGLMHMAREALVKSRTAAKNRSNNLTLTILKRHNVQQFRQIEGQIAAIEKETTALIKAEPDLARRFHILVSIPCASRP